MCRGNAPTLVADGGEAVFWVVVAVPWSPSPLLLTTRSLLAALSAPPRPQWWTKDRSDSRWNVTLRTLLSFTSGFGEQEEGSSNVTRTCNESERPAGLESLMQRRKGPQGSEQKRQKLIDASHCARTSRSADVVCSVTCTSLQSAVHYLYRHTESK